MLHDKSLTKSESDTFIFLEGMSCRHTNLLAIIRPANQSEACSICRCTYKAMMSLYGRWLQTTSVFLQIYSYSHQ